jgi:putative endonuclease
MSLTFSNSLFALLDSVRNAGRQRTEAPHMSLARRGEDLAHRYAESELGWRIVARNYRHPLRRLEIDLIGVESNTLVVAEVKTRSSDEVSHPLRAVDRRKAAHVSQGARSWIAKAEMLGMSVRFDVMTVIIGDTERVEYHRDVYAIAERPAV